MGRSRNCQQVGNKVCPGATEVSHLAVTDRWIAACIRGQQASQSIAAAAVHDRVAWEGPVQVLLDLHVPVGVVP